MRLLGHPGSDLDETWWKLFPGVSRSFLNSSGTKIRRPQLRRVASCEAASKKVLVRRVVKMHLTQSTYEVSD